MASETASAWLAGSRLYTCLYLQEAIISNPFEVTAKAILRLDERLSPLGLLLTKTRRIMALDTNQKPQLQVLFYR